MNGGSERPTLTVRTTEDFAALVARGPLRMGDLRSFEAALSMAIGTGRREIVVDLRRATAVELPIVAAIVCTAGRLQRDQRILRVRSAGRTAGGDGVSAFTAELLAS